MIVPAAMIVPVFQSHAIRRGGLQKDRLVFVKKSSLECKDEKL